MSLNITLRQAERLALMKVPLKIQGGKARIGIIGAIVIIPALVWHRCIVRELRELWAEYRATDKIIGNQPHRFWESYRCMRYQARLELGERWFNRA